MTHGMFVSVFEMHRVGTMSSSDVLEVTLGDLLVAFEWVADARHSIYHPIPNPEWKRGGVVIPKMPDIDVITNKKS